MPAETFGQYLKRERELRHISLEEVASGTKIAIQMLRAMETDCWDEIPAEVFIRGFIKQYAEFIGLVPDDVYLRYQEERGILPGEDFEEAIQCSTALKRTCFSSGRLFWVAVLLLVALLILAFSLFFSSPDKDLDTEDRHAASPPAVSTQGGSGDRKGAEHLVSPVHPEAGESQPVDGTEH
jgi:cytoskeleton protein RodZ